MAVFRYKTYDASGRRVSGVIDADSPRQATSKLKSRGLYPFELSPELVSGEREEKRGGRKRRVKRAEITAFTRQMATLVASGMPLVESLSALAEQSGSGSLRKAIIDIKERVSSGSSFSDALSAYPAYFSPVYVNLVKAGETGGSLDEIMEELAELGEKQEAIRGKVAAAMAYPIFMTVIGTAVLAVLFVLVIPKIISIFENVGQGLPLPTRLLVSITNFIHGQWISIAAAIVLIVFLLYKAYGTKRGKSYVDGLALKAPLIGSLVCKMEVSRFSRTLSLLLRGGVPITQALDIVKDVVRNTVISGTVAEAGKNLAEGGDISSALKGRAVFPPVAVHMIAVGEKGGRLEEMLLNVADSFDREVERVASSLTSILEPLLIVVMGVVVGFIALAILLPIFEMNMLVG